MLLIVQIILNLLATFVALVAYYLLWKKDEKKLHDYRYLLLVAAMMSVGGVWGGFIIQEVKSGEVKAQNARLTTDITFLKGQSDRLQDKNDTLIGKQNKLIEDNKKILGKLNAYESLLASKWQAPKSETAMEEFRERRATFRDSSTGLVHSRFWFGARKAMPLKNISIQMLFDKPIVSISPKIVGAVVLEQGTSIAYPDSTRFLYKTGYLSESNDICIDVASKDAVMVLDLQLVP